MNLLAVKAAEERAKYIVDKYHYGIDCNACKYDYSEYAIKDFISQCFSICTTDEDVLSVIDTVVVPIELDCTPTVPVEVVPTVCSPSITITEI